VQDENTLREVAKDCVHCGFCLPACPTYQLWAEEMDSPRGRIYLVNQILDGAELTDRQRECFSLKFEYGLRVSAIVNRLGLSRKTVDEHIAAAKRRTGWSQIKEKQKANSARLNPGE